MNSLPGKESLSIAFLVGSFPETSETFISRKVDYLLAQGHDVHVFCVQHNRDKEHPTEWRNRIHCLPWRRHCPGAILRYLKAVCLGQISINTLVTVTQEMKKADVSRLGSLVRLSCLLGKKWDIVHAHFLHILYRFVGLPHIVNCPIVGAVYGADVTIIPYSEDGLHTVKVSVQQTSALTFSSEFLRKQLHSFLDTESKVEQILHPEVPTLAFTPSVRKRPHSTLRLLSVGRLAWAKGYPFALVAIRRLLDDGLDIEYRVVGEGPQRQEIEYTIRNLNLSQHVHLEGALPNERVAELMSWADILILPSVKEEFGVVLIEAQASGLPIIASRVGGVPEATCESETTLLVRSHSPEELASTIKYLATDHTLYQRLSENGPAHAEQFSSEKIGEQLVVLYRSLLKHPKIDDVEDRSDERKFPINA